MKKIYTLIFAIISMSAFSQTTIIDPAGPGGFEWGTTFAANNWIPVNAGTTVWAIGTASFNAGVRGAYVSNNGGTSNDYTIGTSQTSHFHRAVTVPAGESSITLSFNWKGNGESGYDRLLVYTAPIAVTPVAGTPASSSTTLTGATLVGTYNSQTTWQSASISLDPALAGTTFRIIFTWQNDASGGTTPPTSIDNISLVSSPPYLMNATPVTTCSGIFCDPQGVAANYTDNNNTITKTFTSSSGTALQFVFTAFETNEAADNLKIYDGPNTGSPLLGTYSQTTGPGTVTSSGTTMTFTWTTDNNNASTIGWVASISCVPLPPANNECANATLLTVNPDLLCGTVTAGTVLSATASAQANGCSGTADDDVWYKFVATSTTHQVSILNVAGSTTDMYHSVYSGACGSLTQLTCNDADVSTVGGLTIGATYYVRVYTYTSTTGQTSTFNVCIGTPPPPPSNDECVNAIALTVNSDYNCGTVTAGTVAWATASAQANSCFGTADDDVWYKFVATSTSHRVSLLNVAGSTTDMYHSVYSGACGSLTNLVCSDADVSNLTGLTIGATYYVRVYTYTSTTGQTSTFNVCIGTPPPPPSNDNCAGAIVLTVNSDDLCGVVTAATTTSATNSGTVACAGSGADDDVWFRFTATNTSHTFSVLNATGSTSDMVHEIFSGACGSLTSIACSDPESSQWGGFTIGQVYYVRVYTYTSTTGQSVNFNFCVGTPPPPPSNDNPCGAIALAVNAGGCSYQSAVLNTSTTATAGIPAPGCASLGPDIWFTAVVPASGRLIVDLGSSGGPTDMDMAWYTATGCSGTFTLIECDDADSQDGSMAMICRTGVLCTVPGDCAQNATLTPGQTIYIRVWEYGGGTFGPFDICAYEPAAPGAASNCASATNIAALPFSQTNNTTCCRANSVTSAQGCASTYQDGEDFLYTYTPAANQTIDITLTGTSNYTGVFVTDRCPTLGAAVCVGQSTNSSGNPLLCGVNLVAGTTYYIMIDTDPTPNCTPFNISISSSSTPSCGLNYTASTIAFGPDLNAGTNIALPVDDRFSSSYIPIGFPFCFDGFQHTQLLVSSNGYVIFDPIGCASNLPSANAAPGASSGWDITANVPNTTNAPRNCIMFPFQDIYPSLGGTIRYQTLGTAPNRRFVLTLDNVPYYSCTSLLFTGQLKLYETTNNIEMHITQKVNCATWNESGAILGLHNYNGSTAIIPAGYNYSTPWTATNQAWRFTCNCVGCIVLPVELVEFTGEKISTNVNYLKWATATETNNAWFELERKSETNEFEMIAKIDGAGNSNEYIKYSYTDNEAPEGPAYYRLKQIDKDGQFAYSATIVVGDVSDLADISAAYPNPANDELKMKINSDGTPMRVVLVNSGGQEFVLEDAISVMGFRELTFNVASIPPGVYFLKVSSEKNESYFKEKIVIQR